MVRGRQRAVWLIAPIKDQHRRARDGITNNLVAVPCEELPCSRDGHQPRAVRIHTPAMAMGAEIDLRHRMPCAHGVEAGIAEDDGKQGRLKVGAGRSADMVRGIDLASGHVEQPLVAGLAVFRVEQAGEVAFNIVRVAFCSASDEGLYGQI